MKKCSCLLFLTSALYGNAQQTTSILDAERAFAQQAHQENTRAAFLAHFDSSGVIFNGGQPTNAFKFWQGAPAEGPKMLWTPSLGTQSIGHDLGFTTGPFEVRDTLGGKVLGSGQFTSVWRRNANGQWKVIADIGTGYRNNAYPAQQLATQNIVLTPDPATPDIQKLEESLLQAITAGGGSLRDLLAENSVLNMDRKQPTQLADSVVASLTRLNDATYHPFANGLAQRKDLAYVYGQIKKGERTGNYLRIWAHTTRGWVVLAQVIRL